MALKVFDLQCEHGHVFEGWFASSDAFEQQRTDGLLTCPICNSRQISKQLSAPRLNMGRGTAPPQTERARHDRADAAMADRSQTEPRPAMTAPVPAQVQARLLHHMRQTLRAAENVGARFAEEARSMHEGQTAHRSIRGTATRAEQAALLDDGIPILPVPDFLDDERLQ